MNTRDLVLSMLKEIYAGNEFSHILLRQVLEKYDYLEGNEKAFIKRLTEGTLERTIELDYVINQFSNTTVNKMKPLIRALMRMSVYQILYMDSIPDSAVCNEAVKLAALHKFTSLKGFVNGVLRNIVRNKENISYPEKEKDLMKYLSITYSLPEWMVEHFLKEHGKEKTEKICKGLLQERPVTVRIKESLTAKEKQQLLERWKQQGIEINEHPYLPYAYVLEKTEGIKNMAGFEEGMFAVQDVSSMCVAHVAGIKPGMQVLDVCAAPGGKATHAAEKLNGTGQVIARDLTGYKVDFIQENADRLQIDNLWAEEWDACIFDESKEQWADVVFCDAPCSGLGVMGKKRDIKYRLTPDSLKEVTALQRDILNTVWKYVKKDGILVYSTCTINKEENENQVQWIVENLPFEVVSMKEELPEEVKADEGNYGLQLLPGIHETDGFFLCKLRRIG
ncbi:MAG: 16S rRNA (cytosine(967)-C(5))-methyltransferase RsmB [Lachnospiraceae bacterium]|nr:16S rRNA (cytosine(967)-C(5))-methyltransferase RsmB [Lachnospiraceae bacterium]